MKMWPNWALKPSMLLPYPPDFYLHMLYEDNETLHSEYTLQDKLEQ